jgi:hypothetical protein
MGPSIFTLGFAMEFRGLEVKNKRKGKGKQNKMIDQIREIKQY